MKRKIVLFSSLFMLLQVFAFAQSKTIKGTVKDGKTNETIPGATVLVEGTTVATATDMNGAYTINVDGEGKKLVISAVGFTTQILAADKDVIDVNMASDVTNLKEMIVTANAIQREKRSLGYSTAQVTSGDLTQGQNSSPIAALQGKVSGVNITSGTGGPGSATRVVLRGGSSFTGNNQPLIVVDGVPIDNSAFRTQTSMTSNVADDLNNQVDYGNRANDINPEDIASVTILKGPGAAAIYGSRASNGAILYTTKSGKNMKGGARKMDVTLNSSTTFSTVLKLPDFQNQYGQGNIYEGASPDDRRENFSWGYEFDGKERPWGQVIDGKQRVKKYEAIPNNAKDYFNTGVTYNNTLSVLGGNDKSTYYLSMGALNTKGIIPGTSSDKYNVRFNGTADLSNNFSSTYSATYTNQRNFLPAGGQNAGSVVNALLQTARDIPIIDGKDLNDPFNSYDDVTGKYGFYGAYALNPYFVNQAFKNTNKIDRVQGNVSLKYQNEKYKWLSIVDRLGGDIYSERHEQKWKKYSYTPYELPFYAGNDQIYQGKYSQDNYNLNEITNDLMLNLAKDFNDDLKISGMIGHNYRQRSLVQVFAQTNPQGGLAIADYYNLENSNGPITSYSKLTQRRLIGLYGEANVGFKNMLFLGVTARNDWSSTLPVKKRSFFYPSANASFVLSELFKEEFKQSYISYAKIRASVAQVGNDADPYLDKTNFTKGVLNGGRGSTTLPFNNINGYSVSNTIGNPELRPEITTAFEVGVEMNLLKDRLGFDVAYYQNSSKDQIIQLPLAPSTGYGFKTVNAGVIENKGVELLLRGTPISTKDWKLELTATYTKNISEVVSLPEGVDQVTLGGTTGMSIVAAVGKPYGTFYGRDYLRDPQGNVVVDKVTGLPVVNPNSVYFGSYNPDFQGSFRGNLTYKNAITFSFLLDGKKGGQFWSNSRSTMGFVGTSIETTEGGRDPRVWENSVNLVNGQYVTNTTPYSPYRLYTGSGNRAESAALTDASYLKLREVSLSYRLPASWFDKTPIGAISVGVFGNNLYIWTPKENKYADPEINGSGNSNTQGFEFTSIPSQRNFGFNVRVNF